MEEGESELCYRNEKRGDGSRRKAPCKTNKKLVQGTISKGTEELPRTQNDSSNAGPTRGVWWPHAARRGEVVVEGVTRGAE